jgi:hypothetical protein
MGVLLSFCHTGLELQASGFLLPKQQLGLQTCTTISDPDVHFNFDPYTQFMS